MIYLSKKQVNKKW